MAGPSDFRRYTGPDQQLRKARAYVNVETGEVVSRRQYLKAQRGGVSNERYAKERRNRGEKNPMSAYNRALRDYQAEQRAKGIQQNLQDIRTSTDFKSIVRDLKTKDRSATGKKAQALVKLGRRRADWHYRVGETPKHVRA